VSRYTFLRYEGRDIYVEEPLRYQGLHPRRVEVIEDGLLEQDLPGDCIPICVADLPQGAWADYVDPTEEEH
jgi:hypothetical protein